jgi:hypothetical protein
VKISESSIRRIMPRHIKKATPRYKLMCGCQTCVILNDMYQCILLWQKKYIAFEQIKIYRMEEGQEKAARLFRYKKYKSEVTTNGILRPPRVWDAASQLACPKVEVKEEDTGRCFHRFSCVLGKCGDCPKWKTIIPRTEWNCCIPIRYAIYSSYNTCSVHKEMHMSTLSH